MTRSTLPCLLPAAALACSCLALAGCGADRAASTGPSSTDSSLLVVTQSSSPGTAGTTGTASAGLVIEDAWVKAAPDPRKDPMTAAFGTLKNTSTTDITITAARQDASARTELHETVMIAGRKAMREVAGGFTIKAGQSLQLKPGGHHLMLMALTRPIPVGTDVRFTLTTATGQTVTWVAVAKAFTAPPENYVPGPSHAGQSHTEHHPGHPSPATTSLASPR